MDPKERAALLLSLANTLKPTNTVSAIQMQQLLVQIGNILASTYKDLDKRSKNLQDEVSADLVETLENINILDSKVKEYKDAIDNIISHGEETISNIKDDADKYYKIIDDLILNIKNIPKPTDGKDGERGAPGKDGKDGKDGQDGKDANEEAITQNVIKVIKDQIANEEEDGADIVEAINALSTKEEGLKIDASHIKNLPRAINTGPKTLSGLLDVNLSGLTTDGIGRYILGSGGGTTTEQDIINLSTSTSINTNQEVRADASLRSITLALINPSTKQTVTIKKVDTSDNSVFVTSPSLIDGGSVAELSTPEESITLKWTGSTYDII